MVLRLAFLVILSSVACSDNSFNGSNGVGKTKNSGSANEGTNAGSSENSIVSENLGAIISADGSINYALCSDTSRVKKKPINLNFAARSGCPYGVDDNANREQYGRRIAARSKQIASIKKPRNSVVCSMNLKAKESAFKYDDALALTIENYFVMGYLQSLSNYNFNQQNGLDVWDWQKIKEKDYRPGGGARCSNLVSCALPDSESLGELSLDISVDWFKLLPKESFRQDEILLTLMVTGNSSSDDCEHSGLTLAGEMEYIE